MGVPPFPVIWLDMLLLLEKGSKPIIMLCCRPLRFNPRTFFHVLETQKLICFTEILCDKEKENNKIIWNVKQMQNSEWWIQRNSSTFPIFFHFQRALWRVTGWINLRAVAPYRHGCETRLQIKQQLNLSALKGINLKPDSFSLEMLDIIHKIVEKRRLIEVKQFIGACNPVTSLIHPFVTKITSTKIFLQPLIYNESPMWFD